MTDNQESSDEPVGHTPPDSNPQMTVSVDFEATTSYGAAAREVARVTVRDANHQGIQGSFQYLVSDQPPHIEQVGFSVTVFSAERPKGFGPGFIKDLPLARWDRVAQAAVEQAVMQRLTFRPFIENGAGVELGKPDEAGVRPLHIPGGRRDRAIEMVRAVRPDLDPRESKGSARSWNGLVKLAEALDEYTELLATGSTDVVGDMAALHGVAPATVRTWVHRARQAGITATGWLDRTASPLVPAYIRASGEPYRASGAKDSGPDPEDVARFESPASRPTLSSLLPPQPPLTPRQAAFRELGRSFLAARERSHIRLKDARKLIGIEPSVINRIDRGDFGSFDDEAELREYVNVYARALGFAPGGYLRSYDAAKILPDTLH